MHAWCCCLQTTHRRIPVPISCCSILPASSSSFLRSSLHQPHPRQKQSPKVRSGKPLCARALWSAAMPVVAPRTQGDCMHALGAARVNREEGSPRHHGQGRARARAPPRALLQLHRIVPARAGTRMSAGAMLGQRTRQRACLREAEVLKRATWRQ